MFICKDENGYINLQRAIGYSAMMLDRDLLGVWIQILTWAFWYDGHDAVFGGKQIKLKRGQLIVKQREMAAVLRMKHVLLHRKLQKLKSDTRIETQSDRQSTLITVCNWDKYQNQRNTNETQNETQNETRVKHDRNTSETRNPLIHSPQDLEPQDFEGINARARIQTEKIKEEKEYIPPVPEGGGEKIKKPKTYDFTPEDMAIAEAWAEHARSRGTTSKINLDRWADTARLMREKDGLTHEDLRGMLEFVRNHWLWRDNALSLDALRKPSKTNGERKHKNIRATMERERAQSKPATEPPKKRLQHMAHLLGD